MKYFRMRGHRLCLRLNCATALALFVVLILLGSPAVQAQLTPPVIKPTSGLWSSGDGFDFDLSKKKVKKIRQSISGMACTLDATLQRICLMVFDEGAQARYAYVRPGSLVPHPEAVVFKGIEGELDAEAAATDGRYFYVMGSHSAKRGDCSSNPNSRHVIRLAVNPTTGRAMRLPGAAGGGEYSGYIDTGRLWQILQAQPDLAAHVGERKCLGTEPPPNAPELTGQQGINLEGLAAQNGRLYFGFRGPVIQGTARVLALNADAFFAGADPRPSVTRLALGNRRGIRDMVAVTDGLLLLAGPDDDDASRSVPWTISLWNGKDSPEVVQPQTLATLDIRDVKLRKCDKDIKPEALTVLEETPQAYKLLVLSDGLCDGGPLTFTVPR